MAIKTSKKLPLRPCTTGKNPLSRPKGKRGAKNPFGSLGTAEKQPTRFGALRNQGKRMTGPTLLQRAMGKLVQKGGTMGKSGLQSRKGGLVSKK